jgi:hypothetical protein
VFSGVGVSARNAVAFARTIGAVPLDQNAAIARNIA